MNRRLAAPLAAVAVTFLAVGCANLPDSSAPQAIGTIEPAPANSTVPEPTPGREPDLLLRDFFAASTDPTDGHAAARRFLADPTAETWDDAVSATIVDKVDVLPVARTNDTASYTVRANKVGQLGPKGVYESVEGAYEATVRLVRVDGEWRIDELPAGVTMDRQQFLTMYKRHSLYFLDPTGSTAVPDLRWVAAGPQDLADTLVELLVEGPKRTLAGAVTNELEGVRLSAPITKTDGRSAGVGIGFGGLRIEFSGTGSLDLVSRDRLAAQVVWTLANSEIPGPYVLMGDGKPLDERVPNGWTTADVSSTNPSASASSASQLHALRDGALVRVTDMGVDTLPGFFGTSSGLRSIALARDGLFAAGVVAQAGAAPNAAATLMLGEVEGFASPALEGATLTRPTWGYGDTSVWTVVDGSKVVRIARDGSEAPAAEPVDTTDIAGLGSTITDFRLSRDGVRAAMIVDGKVYVATVVPTEGGGHRMAGAVPVAVGLGSPAVSLDWSTGDSIVVARAASDIPVVTVAMDGSRMDALPSRNLTPPVTSVDAGPAMTFVADSRAVFQLNSNDPAGDRYWREVPGLTGVKAIPVLPG